MHLKIKISAAIYLCVVIISLLCTGNDSQNRAAVPGDNCPASVSVYRTETGIVDMVPFEQYVSCTVASEVPGSFHTEALKAQAVASRTYAAAKVKSARNSGASSLHPVAPLCDTTHCQVYRDTKEICSQNGWNKIQSAVNETRGELLYYENNLVTSALFHASSGGKTENSEDVFVSAVPYLRSVSSPYENDFNRNGHGVGMSQQGANGMANAGYTYKEILSHYYQGTSVY